MRGNSLNMIVENPWFQDPLLKTIRYLENIDQKDQASKIQFLNGMSQIINRFDKKALLKKVIPLLINTMKINTQLSVNILPSMLQLVSQDNFVTMTEFREIIWPGISQLCKAKELPAQSIFIICKNAEVF